MIDIKKFVRSAALGMLIAGALIVIIEQIKLACGCVK